MHLSTELRSHQHVHLIKSETLNSVLIDCRILLLFILDPKLSRRQSLGLNTIFQITSIKSLILRQNIFVEGTEKNIHQNHKQSGSEVFKNDLKKKCPKYIL